MLASSFKQVMGWAQESDLGECANKCGVELNVGSAKGLLSCKEVHLLISKRLAIHFVIMCLGSQTVSTAQAEIKIGIAGPTFSSVQVLGAEKAIQEINASGGLLDQTLTIVSVDDRCSADMAVPVARQMVEMDVAVVMGHVCSDVSIAASHVYEDAKIVMISCCSTSPQLTEQGRSYIFRVSGRDDHQGVMAGNYIAENFSGQRIAILHNGRAYGRSLAGELKRQLIARGQDQLLLYQYFAEEVDYFSVVNRMDEFQPDVLYVTGLVNDVALIVRQVKERFPDLTVFSGDVLAVANFVPVAGEAAEGAMFTFGRAEVESPDAVELMADLTEETGTDPGGFVLHSYASVQAWSEAVRRAGSTDADAVSRALRENQFDTVLGKIGFDKKGDVTGIQTFSWHVYNEGSYEPLK